MDLFSCQSHSVLLNNTVETPWCENFTGEIITEVGSRDTDAVEIYVIGTLCVIGLLGNSLALIVFHTDRKSRECLRMLFVLAICDIINLCANLLRFPITTSIRDSGTNSLLKMVSIPLVYTTQSLSIWMMIPITVERYWAVCHSFRGKKLCGLRVKVASVVVVVVAAVLYNIPRWLDHCIMALRQPCTDYIIYIRMYVKEYATSIYFDIYDGVSYLILLYVIPLSILSILNARLVRVIMYSRKLHRSIGGSKEAELSTTVMLIAIVVQFIICQTPGLILRTLTFTNRHFKFLSAFPRSIAWFNTVRHVLTVFNSAVNFILYCVFGRTFRRQLKVLFKRRSFNRERCKSLCTETLRLDTTNNLNDSSLHLKPSR